MELTSKESAVIYNALCDRRKKLEKLLDNKPEVVEDFMKSIYEDFKSQIITIDELIEDKL